MQYLNLSIRHLFSNQYCAYISVGSCGSGWHTAEAEIISSYRAFSNEKIHGRMGVYIGLNSANVTLEAMHYNKSMDVNFNERLIDFVFDMFSALLVLYNHENIFVLQKLYMILG